MNDLSRWNALQYKIKRPSINYYLYILGVPRAYSKRYMRNYKYSPKRRPGQPSDTLSCRMEPWEILYEAEAAYKRCIREVHPDHTGGNEALAKMYNNAIQWIRRWAKGKGV